MEIIYIMLPCSILLGAIGCGAYYWSVKSGQLDDLDTPAIQPLTDDISNGDMKKTKENQEDA